MQDVMLQCCCDACKKLLHIHCWYTIVNFKTLKKNYTYMYVYIWLRVAKQFLSCALVRGRGVVFRHYYKSIAKCAGKDYRDGAVVPFE